MRLGVGALIGGVCMACSCVDEMHVTGVPTGSAGSGGGAVPVENGLEDNSVLVAPTGSGGSSSDLLGDAGPMEARPAPPSAAPASTSLGPLQCGGALQCFSVNPRAGCVESAPGGVCVGCDDDDPCPSGTACAALGPLAARECVRPCDEDTDCNIGLACSDGRCAPRACAAPGDCPPPYASCRDGLCSRPRCDEAFCPIELVCSGSGFCVEPELAD